MVYKSKEISFNNKDKSTDTCCTIDEPWKYYAKWKKAVTKGKMLYGYYEMSTLGIHRDWKLISGCLVLKEGVGLGEGSGGAGCEWGVTANGYGIFWRE